MPWTQPSEGYRTSDGRLVYSIIFNLESPPPKSLQLIVNLDSDGNSRNRRARAAESGKRIVDVFPGQALRFQDKQFVVKDVAVYRGVKNGVTFGWP